MAKTNLFKGITSKASITTKRLTSLSELKEMLADESAKISNEVETLIAIAEAIGTNLEFYSKKDSDYYNVVSTSLSSLLEDLEAL